MESIDNLICTLEILSSALSAKAKDKAIEAIALLVQQFTATFGHATHIFLAILFLQTMKVHVLCGEFPEASGGVSALLARLRAVNTAVKQPAARSAPANSDASADDVLDDLMTAEATPRYLLPRAKGADGKPGTTALGVPTPEYPFAAYPLIKFILTPFHAKSRGLLPE